MSEDKKYLKYWGKAGKRQDGAWECHLLPYHCLDVAAVGMCLSDRLWIAEHIAQKIGCDKSEIMPVIFIDNETQWEHYNSKITTLIRAADTVSELLSYAVSDAMKEKKKKDKEYTRKIKAVVSRRFWKETEREFYRQIAFLRDEVMQNKHGIDVCRAWHNYLAGKKPLGKALEIFDDISQAEMIEDVNAERVANAHKELIRNLSGKKLKVDILGLPKQGGSHGD